MNYIRLLSIVEDTMVDGPGFRTTIYCAGCQHACPGCHNPQSWNEEGGRRMSITDIMDVIKADPFANVTFTGGDPMFQAEGFCELAQAIKSQTQKTIWCFSGFTFEVLLKNPEQRKLLQFIDVLVDGPFVQSLRDEDLLFRGSSNQRILDVPKSLKAAMPVLYELNLGL